MMSQLRDTFSPRWGGTRESPPAPNVVESSITVGTISGSALTAASTAATAAATSSGSSSFSFFFASLAEGCVGCQGIGLLQQAEISSDEGLLLLENPPKHMPSLICEYLQRQEKLPAAAHIALPKIGRTQYFSV